MIGLIGAVAFLEVRMFLLVLLGVLWRLVELGLPFAALRVDAVVGLSLEGGLTLTILVQVGVVALRGDVVGMALPEAEESVKCRDQRGR
jgi:hypothetical protein